MMKTVCVAAVVLSLFAVGQPAPLACNQLLKPAKDEPDRDMFGTWHLIAMSSDSCWFSILVSLVFSQSVSFDITSKSPSNVYSGMLNAKMDEFCFNTTETWSLSTVPDNEFTEAEEMPDLLLQTSCPDCLVVKDRDNDDPKTIMFLSRRKKVTDDELKEFEKTVECIGWSKPLLYDAEDVKENCKRFDQDSSWEFSLKERQELGVFFVLKIRSLFMNIISCIFNPANYI
ncbi:uncharacterized protein ACJ7VT_003567 [Polymixia lowei]